MKRFSHGQRVVVSAVDGGLGIEPTTGRVHRLRMGDDGAWVALDHRVNDYAHPFPADDEHGRGTHVLAYPEDCEEVSK